MTDLLRKHLRLLTPEYFRPFDGLKWGRNWGLLGGILTFTPLSPWRGDRLIKVTRSSLDQGRLTRFERRKRRGNYGQECQEVVNMRIFCRIVFTLLWN